MYDLDTLARRSVDALHDDRPDISDIAARAEARQRRHAVTRAGAASLLAVLVIVGGFLVLGPAGGQLSVDTAARPDPRSELSPEWDVVIFLGANSTEPDVQEVIELIEESPAISDFSVSSQQDVYDEFVEFFTDDPELLSTIAVETMPIRVSVAVDDPEAPIFFALDGLAQVQTIIAETGTIPEPIRVNGDPIFDIASSRRLFLGSIAGSQQGFVRCMADEGFEVTVLDGGVGFFSVEYLQSLEDGSGGGVADEFLILDGDERGLASEWGFGLFSVNLLPSGAQAGPQRPPGVSEGDPYYQAAYGGFLGIFSGGCSGDAEDLWRGSERDLPREQIREITDAFVLDQRVIGHYREFSTCMAEQGFTVTSPLDAYEQTGDRLEDLFGNNRPLDEREAALQDEIDLAVATIDCGESVRDLVSPALRPVWEEYAPDDWDDNEFHIASAECLGAGAYNFDLTQLFTVEGIETLFPDSCFE